MSDRNKKIGSGAQECKFCGKPSAIRITPASGGEKWGLCPECAVNICSVIEASFGDCLDLLRTGVQPEELLSQDIAGLPHPREIKGYLDQYVIGQEDAKKTVAVGIYNHYKRIASGRTDIKKSNILMLGPTGCGKTEIARTVAQILDVPFAIADATTLTEAGYVGDDVENILLKLIQAADGDIARAEKGIIYIDEIDKIARTSENPSITRDVSGEGVQQALLKIIEGTVSSVPTIPGRKHPKGDRYEINTENILFICGGAFEGLTMKKETTKKHLGFGDVPVDTAEEKHKKPDAHAIVKQGLIPELVGRLPIIVELNKLTEEELKRILVEPKNSLVSQYRNLLEMDGIELTFTDEALSFIAAEAYRKDTGARGLKGIIEEDMNDFMYEAPDGSFTEALVIVRDGRLAFETSERAKAPGDAA